MKDYALIVQNKDSFNIFKNRMFNPIKGALRGYKDGYFKFVNRGTLVESNPIIHKNRGPNAEVKMTLADGNELFYAKVDNNDFVCRRVKHTVTEAPNGWAIHNSQGEKISNVEVVSAGKFFYIKNGENFGKGYDSREVAMENAYLKAHELMLELERNA